MKILSIETSCDETAFAAIDATGDLDNPEFNILGTSLYSQIEKHKEYGGVFPALAKREHAANVVPLLNSLLEETGMKKEGSTNLSEEQKDELRELFSHEENLAEDLIEYFSTIGRPDFDMIAVTSGPGLEPALWVGINFARALSIIWQIPILPVNHMEGHIVSVLIEAKKDITFPAVALLISGGHTELVKVNGWGDYEILGKTKDDAVGEAFDKVARLLGLEYPGGPKISKLAGIAREKNLNPEENNIKLPRPMLNTDDFDFSFSGLKTAALYLVKGIKEERELDDVTSEMISLEFEDAVTEVLLKKTKKALEASNSDTLIIGGGVISNKYLRDVFNEELTDTDVLTPATGLSTDNAVMIGIAGFLRSFKEKAEIGTEITADGGLRL